MTLFNSLEQALGTRPTAVRPLTGGSVGDVYRVETATETLVAKVDNRPDAATLDIEGAMLLYLAAHTPLPVPEVRYNSAQLLVMVHLPGSSRFSAESQTHAAELLADLHSITTPTYGFAWDTVIGGLHQPNTPTDAWITFFREQRLLFMGQKAAQVGRLPQPLLTRLERFADQIDRFLSEPAQPALIHGDVWTNNVLALNGRITGFLDPAIYFADPEIELAFTTLFNTFGKPFFRRYAEIRPIAPGFFEERRDIYNLYPLLVHVRLFGGSYIQSVDQILRRFGY